MYENLVKTKLKSRGNKNKLVTAFALILLMSFVAATAVPSVNAHSPAWNIPTYAYLTVIPNPVGTGQSAYVTMWIDKAPPTAYHQYGDVWQNYKLTITQPDGTVQNAGPFTSDKVGGYAYRYTPDKIGNYTFVFNFGGDTVRGDNPMPTGSYNKEYVGDYFMPSTSPKVTLAVTKDQIPSYPSTPLPTGYWQRPIEATNLDWYQISGNWLGLAAAQLNTGAYSASNNYNPYTTAPNTPHILWTKMGAFGGLMGGEFGGTEESNYYSTSHNEPKFEPVILNGVLYYTQYPGSVTYPEGWAAVDLRTGATKWVQNTSALLRMGQILSFKSFDQYGGTPFLWGLSGTTYSLYDAMTGNWILNIVKGVSMTISEAADGSLLGYYVNSTDNTLRMWNSTKCIMDYGNATKQNDNPNRWRPPQGASVAFDYGIQWSVPLPANFTGVAIGKPFGINAISDNVLVLVAATPSTSGYGWQPGWQVEAGYSAQTGNQLWIVNRTVTPWTRLSVMCAAQGTYVEYTYETGVWTAYNIATGVQKWQTDPNTVDSFGSYAANGIIAYGKLYAIGLGGYISAFNIDSGKLLWTYSTGSSGYETIYGTWPFWVAYNLMTSVADGKIFVGGGHEYSPPMFRGAQLYAIDANTGQKTWGLMSFAVTAAPAVADGSIVYFDSYDNQIYCLGKGSTATTVSTQNFAATLGKPVLIQGTVTDQSPGQTCLGIPAAGTPAISDNCMTSWMEYLYMQQPKPTNATGVKVHLTAIDPNGNAQEIGTTTTDTNGKYGITWTPPVAGTYHVTASFEGSESYYSSEDTTYFAVGQAVASPVLTSTPTSTVAPTPTQTAASPSPSAVIIPPTSGMPTTTYIAIGSAVVVIVAAAAAFILRKRK